MGGAREVHLRRPGQHSRLGEPAQTPYTRPGGLFGATPGTGRGETPTRDGLIASLAGALSLGAPAVAVVSLARPTVAQSPPAKAPGKADGLLPVGFHGGGWANGSKAGGQGSWLAWHGYAVAVINCPLSGEAIFPPRIEDCRSAVRWLRVNAKKCNLGPDRFGAAGHSAESAFYATYGQRFAIYYVYVHVAYAVLCRRGEEEGVGRDLRWTGTGRSTSPAIANGANQTLERCGPAQYVDVGNQEGTTHEQRQACELEGVGLEPSFSAGRGFRKCGRSAVRLGRRREGEGDQAGSAFGSSAEMHELQGDLEGLERRGSRVRKRLEELLGIRVGGRLAAPGSLFNLETAPFESMFLWAWD